MVPLAPILDVFYEKRNIGAKNFACQFADQCEKKCTGSGTGPKRAGPFGAGVGKNYKQRRYQKERIPGLVFLSLGQIGKHPQSSVEYSKFLNDPSRQADTNNPHWKATKQHGLGILTENGLEGYVDEDNAAQHFCNVNSVKCRDTSSESDDPDIALFENCRNHILAELEFLKPDVLVVQGKNAWFVLKAAFESQKLEIASEWQLPSDKSVAQPNKPDVGSISYSISLGEAGNLTTRCSEVVLFRFADKHPCLMLWTYHCAYRKDKREISSQLVQDGINSTLNHARFNEEIHPLIVAEYLKLLDQRFK